MREALGGGVTVGSLGRRSAVRRAKRHGEWVDRLLRRRARHAAPASNVVVDGSFTACIVKGSTLLQMPRAAENRSRELRYARRVKSQKGRPPVREKLRGTLPAGPLWREVKRVAPNACARWAEMTGRFWKKRRSQIMRATPAMRMEANSRAWDEPNLQNSCTSQAIEPSPSRLRAFPLSPFDLWRGQRVGQGSLPRNSLVKPSKLPPFERPNQNFGKEPKNFNQGRGISCDHYAYCKATRPRQEPFESFAAAEPSSQCLCEACAMKIM